jgi:hypothetical protein
MKNTRSHRFWSKNGKISLKTIFLGLFAFSIVALVALQWTETKSIVKAITQEWPRTFPTSNSYSSASDLTIFTLTMSMDEGLQKSDRDSWMKQWNAISSWSHLVGNENVLVFVSDEWSCDYLSRSFPGMKCRLDRECINAQYRRTDLSCVWRTAHDMTDTEYLLFINADIILLDDLIQSFKYVSSHSNKDFIMIGQRSDLEVSDVIDFSNKAQVDSLKKLLNEKGKLHGEWGLDYFLHSKTGFEKIRFPSFLAGVFRWDNWLVSSFLLQSGSDVVDATGSVRIIHQEDSKRSDHYARSGADHNHFHAVSSSGTQYRLGNTLNAGLLLKGACPNCTLSANMNRDKLGIKMFDVASKVDESGERFLAFIVANAGNLPIVRNWICWAKRAGFPHFLVVVEDLTSLHEVKSLNVTYHSLANNTHFKIAVGKPYESAESVFRKAQVLGKALVLGLSAIWIDEGSLLQTDPLPFFREYAHDLLIQESDKRYSIDVFMVRSTIAGRFYWRIVQECMQNDIKRILSGKSNAFEKHSCVNSRFEYLLKKRPDDFKTYPAKYAMEFRYVFLDPAHFPDSSRFFKTHLPQKLGVSPVIIPSRGDSPSQIQEIHSWWNLWALDSRMQCFWSLESEKQIQSNAHFGLDNPKPVEIHVFAFEDPMALANLLTSLLKARYGSEKVPLTIHIDAVSQKSSGESRDKRAEILDVAKKFEWIHGDYSVMEHDQHVGTKGMFHSITPKRNVPDGALAIFEETSIVSKAWFLWVRHAMNSYFTSEGDSIMGLSINKQLVTSGPLSHLNSSKSDFGMLVRLQEPSANGFVWRQKHYKEYQSFLQENREPCVPMVEHTQKWLDDEEKGWMAYMSRFAWENGYTSLYPGPKGAMIFGTSINDTLMHFLLKDELTFPDLSQVPIYDCHFERVSDPSGVILSMRKNLYPKPLNVKPNLRNEIDTEFFKSHCYTRALMESKYRSEIQQAMRLPEDDKNVTW